MSTSVARLIPSISEWRHPYLLSNLDLVTASLTLMAVNSNSPACSISLSRCTPVVVSSDTPLIPRAMVVHRSGCSARLRVSTPSTTANSSESAVDGSGTAPTFSNSTPLCTRRVASPPSSRIMVGPSPGQTRACSVHHQYSSSDSPFHAKTGTPAGASGVPSGPTATAAAAWSWVEKMLQLAQRTSAPRATKVSMSTAVWMVMCSEPVILAPRNGCSAPCSARMAMRPGISCSASSISLRPNSARDRSATLKSGRRCSLVMVAPSLWPATTGKPEFGRPRPRRSGPIGSGPAVPVVVVVLRPGSRRSNPSPTAPCCPERGPSLRGGRPVRSPPVSRPGCPAGRGMGEADAPRPTGGHDGRRVRDGRRPASRVQLVFRIRLGGFR